MKSEIPDESDRRVSPVRGGLFLGLAAGMCIPTLCIPSSCLALGAQFKGKQFLDKKAGLQLELPSGWNQEKTSPDADSVADFKSADEEVTLEISHGPVRLKPEEMLAAFEGLMPTFPSYRKLSTEAITISGIPATKIVTVVTANRFKRDEVIEGPVRRWQIVVMTKHEYWLFVFTSGDQSLRSTDNPYYQQVQAIIASIHFLEPVLSRLKGEASPLSEKRK